MSTSFFKANGDKEKAEDTMSCEGRPSPGSQEEDISELDNPFTQYYGQLTHQQNMLQDSVRTGTYQAAMLEVKAN